MTETVLDLLFHDLTDDTEVREILVGAFFAAVVSRRVGLASTLRRFPPSTSGFPVYEAGALLPSTALALAARVRSNNLLDASVGLAALNSSIEVDLDRCDERNAGELIATLGEGRRVAVVGDFPFVERLRGVAGQFWVFEQGGRIGPDTTPSEQMAELLPRAEVAAVSSTTLLNHTLDDILARLRPDCFTALVGPSTPLTPLLFQVGVDALCGSVVVDPEQTMACLSQGATFRQVRGVRHVVMSIG